MTTFEQAEQIAYDLTSMSTTGEDFLVGRLPSVVKEGEIVIGRYLDESLEQDMLIDDAIRYASTFALGGAMKTFAALEFLRKHGCLDECRKTKRLINRELAKATLLVTGIPE